MDQNNERSVPSSKDRAKIFSAKSHRQRLRIASVVAYFVVAVAVLALVFFGIAKLFFSVDTFIVNGSAVYNHSEVVKACGDVDGDILFTVDTDEIVENIKKKLPFVESVNIKKEYPGTLIINIVDEKESFYFKYDDRFYVISSGLKVLAMFEDEVKLRGTHEKIVFVSLDEIKQIEMTKEIVFFDKESYRRSEKLLKLIVNEALYDKMTAVDLSELYDVRISYDGRVEMYLGSHVDADKKLANISSILSDYPETVKGYIYIYDADKAHVSLE